MTILENTNKTAFVADIAANESVDDIFVLTQAQQFQAKNGPFWRLSLQDASGQMDGKVWSPLAQEFSDFTTNAFYRVIGRSSLYKDKVELSVSSITLLDQEAVDKLRLGDFIAVSPYSPEAMLNELKGLCELYVSHPPLVRFFDLLFNDDVFIAKFIKAPAAKAMHHAYAGGLLEHTLSICRLCMSIADNYPAIDRQILLAGAVCHDLGKIWELSSGVSIDYTDEGRLVGHITLGLERITPYMQRAGLETEHIMHIQHLILSHHGSYEFGSSRLPSTAEAFVLHFADNIDAKLQQVSQALEDGPTGSHWSGFVRGLDRQVYKPTPLPGKLAPDVLRNTACGLVEQGIFPDQEEGPSASSLFVVDRENDAGEGLSVLPGEAQDATSEDIGLDDIGLGDIGVDNGAMDFPEQDTGYLDALVHDVEDLWQIDQSAGQEAVLTEVGDREADDREADDREADDREADAYPAEYSGFTDSVLSHGEYASGSKALSHEEVQQSAASLREDSEVALSEVEPDHGNAAALGTKEKMSSNLKQSSLPLLEQCSLLSKE